MPSRTVLTDDEVKTHLHELPDWEFRAKALHRELRFRSFTDAFSFMTAVAFIAERRNHHPNWTNVYDRVTIELTTHDRGGVTGNDIEMAQEISEVFGRFAQ